MPVDVAEAEKKLPDRFEIDLSPITKAVHDDIVSVAESIKADNARLEKMWGIKPLDTADHDDKAPLGESLVAKVKSSTNMVIPVAVGGFGAIVGSELIDGLMISRTKTTRGIVKAAGAFAVYTWGKKIPFMGTTGKNVAAALLLFDALRDLTPISEWASVVANKVSKAVPAGGLGDQAGRNARNSAFLQANLVAKRYQGRGVGI